MAYTFDPILAIDPSNPQMVAANSAVTIFAPDDASKTPLVLATVDGLPLSNPITVNGQGFGPAFQHATLDRVAWEGGGLSNYMTSFDGIKEEAVEARQASEAAAGNAGAAAVADIQARIEAGEFKGEPGRDGSNVIPTDQAVADSITSPGSPAHTALSATIAGEVAPVKAEVVAGRGFARSVSQRGAPVAAVVRLSGGRTVPPNDADYVLSFAFRDFDTDYIHPLGSKLQVPTGMAGIWNFSATVRFATIPAGHTLSLLLRKNGTEFVDADAQETNGKRRYLKVNYTNVVNEGDYFEVVARQSSTTDQTIDAAFTHFKAERLGDHVGIGAGVTFDSGYKYFGTSKYAAVSGPASENMSKSVNIVDDPILGPKRQVVRLDLHPHDNTQQYPRVQMATPDNIKNGDELWVGFAAYFPEDFPVLTNYGCTLHELYGYPFGGFSSTVLRAQRDMLAYWPEQPFTDPAPWSIPLVRGRWTDFVFHFVSSTDPAAGFIEIYVNIGTGMTQQLINGQSRLYLATRKAGVNDGGNNYSSLKITHTENPNFTGDDVMTMHYANHKIGTSLAAVDPKSH